MTGDEALLRYENAVYAYFLGEHALAAELFYPLVVTGALGDGPLLDDAKWYLAESLYLSGNLGFAEARFIALARDDAHPLREDAVRRLLQIYSRTGEIAKFDSTYRAEILQGRVRASDEITYSIGKAFWAKQDFGRAKSYFLDIPADSAWYARARYFLGSVLLMQRSAGGLEASLEHFNAARNTPPRSDEDRVVQELAELAVARVYYELGRFGDAVELYRKVPVESPNHADALRELAWSYVKLSEYRDALFTVQDFLARYGEHEHGPELELILGHLHYREGEFDDALRAYEHVVQSYSPIRDRFEDLATEGTATADHFRDILGRDPKSVDAPADGDRLPPFAIAMILSDGELARSVAMYQDLLDEDDDLVVAEGISEFLSDVFESSAYGSGTVSQRFDSVRFEHDGIESLAVLLEPHESWLQTVGGGVGITESLARLRPERERLQARVADLGDQLAAIGEQLQSAESSAVDTEKRKADIRDEIGTIKADIAGGRVDDVSEARGRVSRLEADLQRIDARRVDVPALAAELNQITDTVLPSLESDALGLWTSFRRVRDAAGVDSAMDPAAQRFDRLVATLQSALSRLRETRRVGTTERSKDEVLEAQYLDEAERVRQLRAELTELFEDAEDVAGDGIRLGFKRLAGFFSDSVMGADMGIVNIFWSEWSDLVADERRIAQERADFLSRMNERYGLVRKTLGP